MWGTCDVLGSLHDEDDRDQEREDLIREAREKQHHVGQGEQAVERKNKGIETGSRASAFSILTYGGIVVSISSSEEAWL